MPTALVLSAGALFGAWQVGAWKALQGVLEPEIVIGASVGAWNGWAIAAGCTPGEIEAEWLSPASAQYLRWHVPWLPWRGVFDARALEAKARDLYEHYSPRTAFGTVLVELPGLRPRMVRNREMTWHHLAAACAFPGGFPPVRLDGKWYCDGGLLSALPLWAAAKMGATRIVALNAMPALPSRSLRAAVSAVRKFAPERETQALPPVLEIRPSEKLGTLRDLIRWTPENAARWIALGESDANRSLAAITSITM